MMFWILVGLMSLLALAFVVIPVVKPGTKRKPLLIVGLVTCLPIAAVLIYQQLGTPTAATQPAMQMPSMPAGMPEGHPSSANAMNMDLGKLADRLAEKLKANPENAEGWALLARTYVELKRHKESLPAFEKASAMTPKDPNLMADYADALAMTSNNQFDKKSEDLVDQALAINPMHVKALMLKATIEFNRKNYQQAIVNWEKLLTVSGLDAERTKQARGSIEEARRMMSPAK
jgi:cytochrome c-type biogenesis protein CcmH